MDQSPAPLNYASTHLPRNKPTRHSVFTTGAWIVFILALTYQASVASYAVYRSPTWPFERFERNVGDPDLFIGIWQFLHIAGVILALLGILHPHRKRWAAILALGLHLWILLAIVASFRYLSLFRLW